jgi:ABC-type amino acid transport substrate-binding protein
MTAAKDRFSIMQTVRPTDNRTMDVAQPPATNVNPASRPKSRRLTLLLLVIALVQFFTSVGFAQTIVSPEHDLRRRSPDPNQLRGGWYPWDPYQYRDYRHGVPILTGFDVEIERALARLLGVEILLPGVAWNDHLEALAAGTSDIAAGATASEARRVYAYFSKPLSN